MSLIEEIEESKINVLVAENRKLIGQISEFGRDLDAARARITELERERDSAVNIAQRAEHRANQAESERDALRAALPPPYRLRSLADWIDIKYPYDPEPEVQSDLRKWADTIDKAREGK